MNRFKLFLYNTVILTLTSILIKSIDMFFSVYVANKIGSEGAGLFELIMSIYLFATTLANAGIYLAATRIVAEEFDTNGQSRCCRCYEKVYFLQSVFWNNCRYSFVLFCSYFGFFVIDG